MKRWKGRGGEERRGKIVFMIGRRQVGGAGQGGGEVPASGITRTPGQPDRIPGLFRNETETSEPLG